MTELELPTLRLATLRRLLATKPAPLVFAADTPLRIVDEALRELPQATVVLVDRDHALCGVMVVADLPSVDRASRADVAMSTRMVVLEPEHDVDAALATLDAHHAEHVVVALAGQLLGVLSRGDLVRAHRPRRAA
ncbi:MAG TPA: CBS domain-containing protein [Kofleriaceae bacterium]|nr:CBS domain-containing protein [Kofleriaceae bacterium]